MSSDPIAMIFCYPETECKIFCLSIELFSASINSMSVFVFLPIKLIPLSWEEAPEVLYILDEVLIPLGGVQFQGSGLLL